MIYLEKFDLKITNPEEVKNLNVSVRNYLYENLDKGLVIFIIPEDLEKTDFVDEKILKKNYKVGFLFDILSIIYSKNKADICNIISEKFHCWISYRQFFSIIKDYEKDRKKYIFQRNLLFK